MLGLGLLVGVYATVSMVIFFRNNCERENEECLCDMCEENNNQ